MLNWLRKWNEINDPHHNHHHSKLESPSPSNTIKLQKSTCPKGSFLVSFLLRMGRKRSDLLLFVGWSTVSVALPSEALFKATL